MTAISFKRFAAAGVALAAIAAAPVFTGHAADAVAAVTRASDDAPTIVATRRLTETQYRNIIADVFSGDIEISGRFEPERREGFLMAIGTADLSITSGGYQQYVSMARSVGRHVVHEDNRATYFPCAPEGATQADDACMAEFVRQYGERLFRRPLTDAEVAERVDLARNGAEMAEDFYAGAELAVLSLLVSPDFLFRIENAETDPATGERRLDDWSMASRLSFLLWDTAPDAELLDAARNGALRTPAGLEAQVDRLVSSPRFEDGVRAFFTDVMQFDHFDGLAKEGNAYPKFSQEVANSAREQTLRTLVDILLTQNGDYRDIFTTRDTFMNRPLAAVYNVPYFGAGDWKPYSFDEESGRAGIFTQITFLSLFSHPQRSSPTKRGLALNEIFLCTETPLPPPNVDFSIVNDVNNALLRTTRARLLAHSTDPGCAGCHQLMDPLGLALEQYDALGQRRDAENGAAIDVTAELAGVSFAGAEGLGEVLKNDDRAPSCMVRNVFAYGVGRDPHSEWETTFLEAQTEAFAENGYRVPAMIKAIATSTDFYRLSDPESLETEENQTLAAGPVAAQATGEFQ